MSREEFTEFKIGDKTITYEDYKIEELKSYLRNTDYVVIKMMELQIDGKDATELKTLYADIIEKRNQAREEINELETLMNK